MKSLLSKLNKDELILIIENIEKNHKKETKILLEEMQDHYEYVIDTCRELHMKFKRCEVYGCKAILIKRGGNSYEYKYINCRELIKCQSCKAFLCGAHFNKCKCFLKQI